MIEYLIEVCVTSDATTTERGRLLERLAVSLLETQGYSVEDQLRFTGMEVDLLCQDNHTREQVLVECKAYRAAMSADTISKLLGNVMIRGASAGWLILTSDLTKDGKGIKSEWQNKDETIRRRLRVYEPYDLVTRLIQARVITDPARETTSINGHRFGEQVHLLVTQRGLFWALSYVHSETGLPTSAMILDATNGDVVTQGALLDWLRTTDCSVADRQWIDGKSVVPLQDSAVSEEFQSIVSVPVADTWSDLRPARPIDFVGRDGSLAEVFSFFDRVINSATERRIVAIKAPSGWGKSSFVIKLASMAQSRQRRTKYFVHAVDSRAAISRRFPDVALASSVQAAINAGFVQFSKPISYGGKGNIVATETMRELNAQLKAERKVICLLFDQYEELLYKPELASIFDEMKNLCSAIQAEMGNIVVGFSWKTDGTITTEHRAYHVWHDLADHRLELDLTPFTEAEVSKAIGRFGVELGEPVSTQLRRILLDNCQGYPWLLKKLCVHIFQLVRSGVDQSEVFEQGLSIGGLFRKDMEKLGPEEIGCIRSIAEAAPAEYFKVSQNYGSDVIGSLINKRLVVRSGTRLSIYWDIFRDYILTEKVPVFRILMSLRQTAKPI